MSWATRGGRKLAPAILLVVLLTASAGAEQDVIHAPGVKLQDEGADQGRIQTLNCTGAGVTCSRSGSVGTLNASGGAGSANVVEVSVDFGATGGTEASTVVAGQSWVAATSKILCAPTLLGTANRAEGDADAVLEQLVGAIHTRVAGTGFTLTVAAPNGGAGGAFLFHCTGA